MPKPIKPCPAAAAARAAGQSNNPPRKRTLGAVEGPLWAPTVTIPQGDGSYVVKAGRPIDRLTPTQFAREVGLHRNTIYPYLGTPALPERFIEYAGVRRIRIHASAVEHFRTHCRNKHTGEPA